MATTKITEKTTATHVNSNLHLLVTQDETVGGVTKHSLRRMEQGVYEWSALPADIRLSIQLLINSLRQTQWDSNERLLQIETWINSHRTVEIGTKDLTNNLTFPFNNSQKSVALSAAQNNGDYIVMVEVTSFVGNVGEVCITDKLTNGFKLTYTGSATNATVKYIVIGGFSE